MKKQFNRMKQLANQTVGRWVAAVGPGSGGCGPGWAGVGAAAPLRFSPLPPPGSGRRPSAISAARRGWEAAGPAGLGTAGLPAPVLSGAFWGRKTSVSSERNWRDGEGRGQRPLLLENNNKKKSNEEVLVLSFPAGSGARARGARAGVCPGPRCASVGVRWPRRLPPAPPCVLSPPKCAHAEPVGDHPKHGVLRSRAGDARLCGWRSGFVSGFRLRGGKAKVSWGWGSVSAGVRGGRGGGFLRGWLWPPRAICIVSFLSGLL